jgi:hypothetical protein
MPTPKECRQSAVDCLKLAVESNDIYAKTALIELAMELRATARELVRRGQPRLTRRNPSDPA